MSRQIEIHGPMWQYECHDCGVMGDATDTSGGARYQAEEHDCLARWGRFRQPPLQSNWVREVSDDGNTLTYRYKEEQ